MESTIENITGKEKGMEKKITQIILLFRCEMRYNEKKNPEKEEF